MMIFCNNFCVHFADICLTMLFFAKTSGGLNSRFKNHFRVGKIPLFRGFASTVLSTVDPLMSFQVTLMTRGIGTISTTKVFLSVVNRQMSPEKSFSTEISFANPTGISRSMVKEHMFT